MRMTGNTCELLSRSKAARWLGIGRGTLNSLIIQGRIGVIRIGCREKISMTELVRFEAENSIRLSENQKKLISIRTKSDDMLGIKGKNTKFDSKKLIENLLALETSK